MSLLWQLALSPAAIFICNYVKGRRIVYYRIGFVQDDSIRRKL